MDNFSWVIGKHSLRMGGEYRYNQFPQLGNEFPRGQFFFNGQFTNPTRRRRHTAQASGGYTGADFLLGDMYDTIIAVALAQADFRNQRMGDLYRRHLERQPAPDHQPGLALGSRAADAATHPASSRTSSFNEPLPNQSRTCRI